MTQACVHRGDGNVVSGTGDRKLTGHEKKMWNWGSHLENTLFSEHGRATWDEMWEMLRDNEEEFRLQACFGGKAHRNFLLVCPHCFAGCRGKYGEYDKPEIHQEARQALSKFLLDKDAGDDGAV